MGTAGAMIRLALVLLCVYRGAGQGLADIAAMVRHDIEQLGTDVHVALGLKRPAVPPPPATVVPVTTQAPATTDWPITTVWPDTSLPPHSTTGVVPTTAAPTPTMRPPASSTTMAKSTSLAPPSSSTAQQTSTAVPTTSTATPSSTAAPTTTTVPATSTATPSSTAAPPTTTAVTSSSAPTTSSATTVPPGDCTNPQSLTFDGGAGVPVGVQGPFNFSGWIYDSGASSPPTYPQAILDQSSSTQVIGVTESDGILLCGVAASGTNAATTATFMGYTLTGTNVNTTASLPEFRSYNNVTFGNTWQPLHSISIVTTGSPTTYTTELWEISFQYLGPV